MAFTYQQKFRVWKRIARVLIVFLFIWGGFSLYFRLGPLGFIKNGIRVVAAPILAQVYEEDEQEAAQLRETYWVGQRELLHANPAESWEQLAQQFPGFQTKLAEDAFTALPDIPFVYESRDAAHLVKLRETYALNTLVEGAETEYEAMLRLGAWVGSQWDHGTDAVPGGTLAFDPVEVIEAGRAGAKFWCEIAAKTMVYAATSMGWEARLVAGSTNGYEWQHALAELWSNQFNKWFVIDTDFNVVYETPQGVPLSAFELCHEGPRLQAANQLQTRPISAPKPSLPLIDLLPYYEYAHIDLRNDWNSRALRRGSPAGGDRATWWTARPSLGAVLSAKVRVDAQARFDWRVNALTIHARTLEVGAADQIRLHIGLVGYSPSFQTFQLALDDGPWRESADGDATLTPTPGEHLLKARILTRSGQNGPIYTQAFSIGL